MLAVRVRFNLLKDIAAIPLDHISADDFAARFLAIVARQVPEEAQADRDVYEAAGPVDAAAFGALSKEAIDRLVGTYLAAEAHSLVVKSQNSDGVTNPLSGERESERLLRIVRTSTEDLTKTTQDVARTVQQQFARLSDIKLPDYSAQYAAAVQATTAFGRQQADFAASWRSALARVQPTAEEFSKQLIDFTKAVQKSLQARLELYPKLAEKVVPLAQRGWFISEYFSLTEMDQLVHAAATHSLDELERCITRLYEENFSVHLQAIMRHYPEREFVLRPAGDAHLRGEYALSAMAFFAQIDGICFQGTERYVFQGGDKNVSSLAAIKMETIERDDEDSLYGRFFALLHEIMWRSITEKLPISYSEKERRTFNYEGINRHTVLHGVAMNDYATKENSLKAFSLLSYMAPLVKVS
jgi:hypothetical protein